MSKKPTAKPRELTPLGTNDLREIGRQLAYFAMQYETTAGEMEKSSLEKIQIKGASNLNHTIDRLNGAIQSLQSGLMDARTRSLPKRKATQQAATDASYEAALPSRKKQSRKGGSK